MTDTTHALTNRMITARTGNILDYLGSTDAALTLPLPEGCAFQLYGADDAWECTVIQDRYLDERLAAHASTAAEAICKAWWQWQAQEGR